MSAIDGGWLAAALGRQPQGLRTVRNVDYLTWRFGSHPTASYVAAGSAEGAAIGRRSVREGRRELVLSDLGGTDAPSAVREMIRKHRPAYSVAWFSGGTPERRWAIRAGLVPVPSVAALTLVSRPLRDLGVDASDPGAWDLSLGDLELL